VKGLSTAAYYWNNPEKTAQTFRGEWCTTGDTFSRDAEGWFHYSGRNDDMLKVGGIWCSPIEIEARLIDHPKVLEAAVVGHADEHGNVKPEAWVVLRDGVTPSDGLAGELMAHCKNHLAPYKFPRKIHFVAELPKTATGKIQKLVADALERTPAGTPLVLATVVRVEGSTYRRAGARLLVSEERWLAGGVSGGCVERDLLRRAFHRTAHAPALVAYDSRSDDEAGWALALGCNGLVEIFLERVVPGGAVHPVETPARWMRAGVAGVLATVVRAPAGTRVGQRLALAAGEEPLADVEDPALRERLERDARAALEARRSAVRSYEVAGGVAEAFLEVLAPPLQLAVFGDGYDVPPLCALGVAVGWDTTLVSSRRTLAGASAAARCDELVVCQPDQVGARVRLRPGAAAVVMTHDLEHDLAILGALLDSPAAYIGLLGPRRRAETLLARIAAARGPLSERDLARVHGPVGLDLGAEGPEEIALAIAAEIQAVTAGRRGGLLREQAGPIHAREGT
jgi:xanthine/CO dehydrogenase XdhC/CoxF family maturation factor